MESNRNLRPSHFRKEGTPSRQRLQGTGARRKHSAGRYKKKRRGKTILSAKDKLLALALLLAVLCACAAGGWLGMHYHHRADPLYDDE